jgi:nitrate reductase alpha subunit
VARQFAENAHKTHGKSMVIIGAAMNHWYHCDMNYRAIINLLVMCGCVGQSGGGWSHYVGQEKLRPQSGWLPLAFGLDWSRPPRQQNSTSFFYAHTDQWRYETLKVSEILSPTAPAGPWDGAIIDYKIRIRGFPVRWKTEITAWEPPFRFVDEQRKGPYRQWIHEHRMEKYG